MLLAAAALSRLNGRVFDFYFILVLYFVNYSVQRWQEFKADRAIEELRSKLSFSVSALRDGQWRFVDAKELVPGDRIRLGLGSIIPADAAILSARNLSVNEAVLTGESLPKEKKAGDDVFSGSFITTGNLEAAVQTTGRNTTFGKTIFSIEQPAQKSILEKDILSISRFLTTISVLAVAVLTVVFILRGAAIRTILTLDLSLVIAGIPIALPAVMAVILSIGAAELARKLVVVRRLSALQDLANVNLLLTDKTGTLTKNEIRVANVISYEQSLSTNRILEYAGLAVEKDSPDAIDSAILKKMGEAGLRPAAAEILNFIPYDSDRKRSTALARLAGKNILVSMGAPQVIQGLDDFGSGSVQAQFEKDIARAASGGFRVLALAIKEGSPEEKHMRVAGLLFLADPLDESSEETLRFMRQNGIGVKILTGDNQKITERIVGELELPGRVLPAAEARKLYGTPALLEERLDGVSAFAEILPQDKYELVKILRGRHIVAATGDGVNDLPALKAANVGIAVAGAVSALKSLADIVLLGQGLAVIKDAVLESRKIFVRLYNYSVYRISESFRLIVTILILGLVYGFYPLDPLQLILLALLNDIPIISLALDRVKISARPAEIKTGERLGLSLLFGSAGTLNSLILFFLMTHLWHLPLPVIQTMFFLKLTVSGHMLIYVAHTKERWYKFLPSKEVIWATTLTQILATTLAVTGYLMPVGISFSQAAFVWLWALLWMQISEIAKYLQIKTYEVPAEPAAV